MTHTWAHTRAYLQYSSANRAADCHHAPMIAFRHSARHQLQARQCAPSAVSCLPQRPQPRRPMPGRPPGRPGQAPFGGSSSPSPGIVRPQASLSSHQQGTSGDGENRTTLNEVIDFFINLPWSTAASWLVVAFLASLLKDFFGITMGTFVLSFVGNGFVESAQSSPLLARYSPRTRRRLLVMLYYSAIISLFSLFGVLVIPDVVREGVDFVSRLQTENLWVVVLEKMRQGLGDGVMDQLERFLLIASSEDVTHAIDFSQLDGFTGAARTQYLGMALQKVLRQYTNAAASFTSEILSFTSRFAIQAGISLILSFLVVWDLPRIAKGVSTLRTSRLAPLYNTVTPSLKIFATLFGKALQAQSRIAVVNTILTALGMWALAIPGMGLLSLFVFICGFIPIAGVIISTFPIGFVALTEYGFMKLALVILMITGVHFVEAYGLNPAIYSAHLKLHPLLVLTVLVVAEHSLGVWGLLLAVPLTVFALDYCICYPHCSVTDVAAKELENVSPMTSVDQDFGSYEGSNSVVYDGR